MGRWHMGQGRWNQITVVIRIWICRKFLKKFYHFNNLLVGNDKAFSWWARQQPENTPVREPRTEWIKGYLGRSVLSLSDSILVDGQVNAWPFSVFTQKQVFGPYTVKSQPIWIKFCMHLLLYGINLWANSDCDRLVGGSRPNQNAFL